MGKSNLKGSLILTLGALIWGFAFVAQSAAAKLVTPMTLNFLRFAISALVLAVVLKVFNIKNREPIFPREKTSLKISLKAGVICGFMLALSANLQQAGIAAYPTGVSSEARAGFLTALYVILVPIISSVFGKRIHPFVWISVFVALLGVYMLCAKGGLSGIYSGDILMFLCAVGFSIQILCVEKYCDIVGGLRLSFLEFLFCSLFSLIAALLFEFGKTNIADIKSAIVSILFLGIMSGGVGYTLQIIGQKYAEASVASIAMSLESVFAALGGWLILSHALKWYEIIGCLLVFSAIILAQLPQFKPATEQDKL
ncbi:MAG: DMT family transporter [Clostridia bacterium]|nr:DMT family transporter [Clostridia bacterium]